MYRSFSNNTSNTLRPTVCAFFCTLHWYLLTPHYGSTTGWPGGVEQGPAVADLRWETDRVGKLTASLLSEHRNEVVSDGDDLGGYDLPPKSGCIVARPPRGVTVPESAR